MYAYSVSTKRSLVAAVVALAVIMSGQRAHAQPGWVLSHQKISDTQGGFTGTLGYCHQFGSSVASLGDLDGDGVGDLVVGAVGAPKCHYRGTLWILFLNADGTVNGHQEISDTQGGFTGELEFYDFFGISVAGLGDLDGDGVGDLAVGAPGDAGAIERGAVWILFLNPDGTVNSHQKISDTEGGFTGILNDGDFFGLSVTSLDDLDGDGVTDLAVGATRDDDGGIDRGAVWILFLNPDGTVKSHQKISDTQASFTGTLDDYDDFGTSLAALGDLDGDGVADLAVGVQGDDDGGGGRGAVWVLFLNPDGTVKAHQKISDTQGGFTGTLDDSDWFGRSVTGLRDLDGDGVADLAVGAHGDDDGSQGPCDNPFVCNRGAVWMLFLNTNGTVKSHQKISDTEGGFTGTLGNTDAFGRSVASLGDLDGDGVDDLAVGAPLDDDGDSASGAVWMLFLDGICLWDLDANGSIGVPDLLALLASWGPCKGCPADFDDNGAVGVSDLLALLANWGPCP